MQRKNIVTIVILTIITCGIYGLYWTYVTVDAFDRNGAEGKFNALITLILCLFTGGIGYLLFGMSANESLNKVRQQKGLPVKDDQIIYMVLGFFIPIVLIALVQDEINRLTDEV